MSGRTADALTSTARHTDLSGLTTSAKRVDTSNYSYDFDLDLSSAAKKADVTKATAKLDGIRKLETADFTKRYGDTIKKSDFYKKNQGKLLALGLTVATLSAWYGTLLAQGYSPAEAWEKMTSDIGDATSAAGEQLLKKAWQAFVVMVHNLAGKHVFEDTDGTEMGLKVFLATVVVVRLFSLMGINIFGLIFSMMFGKRK